MPTPTVEEISAAFDHRKQRDISKGEASLFQSAPLEALVPSMIQAFPRVRNWQGRSAILFWLIRFSRTDPSVATLALGALLDSAYMVRMQACAVLAYSLRSDYVEDLQQLTSHRNAKTRADASAALDAIQHSNHHLWLDRSHTGGFYWVMNPGDDPCSIL